MSGRPAAASRASQIAWATTSPSECPPSPSGWSMAIVPSISGRPGREPVRVDAVADPQAHRSDTWVGSRREKRVMVS